MELHNLPEIEQFETRELQRSKTFWFVLILLVPIILVWFGYVYIGYLNTPHEDFPVETDITIEEGTTVSAVSDILKEAGVVRSSLLLYAYLMVYHDGQYILAGTYHFTEPLATPDIAEAITSGFHVSPSTKVTFPEGFGSADILTYLPDTYADADIEKALEFEGFLFPDTYYIPKGMPIDDILVLMRDTYQEKIRPYEGQFAASGLSEYEVITLASIVEREANDEASMKLVAGILHNRLAIDMPLQVDAAFEYLLGKASEDLTLDDLEMDSPYNTYTHIGLPPTPISNPGLMAIRAVLEPTPSEYLYYLTGEDGEFYYATTFEEHKQNKARYLR
jgi:UPF0755 protein